MAAEQERAGEGDAAALPAAAPAGPPPHRLRRQLRRGVDALLFGGGARESGLTRLIVVHLVQSVGDALVAVALAGTLFFSVPVGQARGRVALYLAITIAPFAVVAPVIGPLLDRIRGRRAAIAVTAVARAVLVLVMARSIGRGIELYPAAFGVLVASKAYGVSRSALVPRVQPPGTTLVQVNSRLSLAALIPATIAAPVGAAVNTVAGPAWTLRLAAVAYVMAALSTAWLPRAVDSSTGERPVAVLSPWLWRGGRLGHSVPTMLRSAAVLRGLSGFLLIFVAFLARRHHIGILPGNVTLAIVIVAVAAGGLTGTLVGTRLRDHPPERLVTWLLAAATACCLVTAELFGATMVVVLAFVAAVAQSLSKLSLDSVIQRDVGDDVRTSAFGRSETVLQLAWVVGGMLGILLPPRGTLGFGLVSAVLAVALVAAWRSARRRGDRVPVAGPVATTAPLR